MTCSPGLLLPRTVPLGVSGTVLIERHTQYSEGSKIVEQTRWPSSSAASVMIQSRLFLERAVVALSDATTVNERLIVRRLVFLIDIAPITLDVAGEEELHILAACLKGFEWSRSCEDPG